MAEQSGQSLHDRQTKAQSPAALPSWIVDLVKLLEDRETIFLGNSRTRVPDFDTHRLAASAAPEQHLAARREFRGVREQVAGMLQ